VSVLLTGKYAQGGEATARSRFNQRGGAAEADVAKTEELRPIADELGCSLAHLALGWALANVGLACARLVAWSWRR
jgi:aryl-alcohol dehydrogenase-like predicted oxidoreductase